MKRPSHTLRLEPNYHQSIIPTTSRHNGKTTLTMEASKHQTVKIIYKNLPSHLLIIRAPVKNINYIKLMGSNVIIDQLNTLF